MQPKFPSLRLPSPALIDGLPREQSTMNQGVLLFLVHGSIVIHAQLLWDVESSSRSS